MVKIAVDCRMLGKSGIGVYLKNILHYWLKMPNYEWVLVGEESQLKEVECQNDNCKIIHCEIPIFSTKELFCFPIDEINRCDLFYSPNFNIPLGIKIPIYITIHDVVFLDYKDFSNKIGYYIRYWALYRAIHLSKKIFTVSEFSKKRIAYHFQNKKDIIVAYNGLRRDLLNKNKAELRQVYNFSYYLFVGNIKRHKGLDILLTAIEGIEKKTVIIGDILELKTHDSKAYKKIISNDNIILTGKISDDNKLYSLIANADALIQPSRYEGFGIPPLEALFLGTPVILSDIAVFKEIYGDLPVTFFKDGDSEDLRTKILNRQNKIFDNFVIQEKYDYKRTSKLILSNIE